MTRTSVPREIYVSVTPGDIAYGRRRSVDESPTAIALRRIYGNALVGTNFAVVKFETEPGLFESYSYALPPEGRQLETLFANGDTVHPIDFTLTWMIL